MWIHIFTFFHLDGFVLWMRWEKKKIIINFQTNIRVVNPMASYRVAVSADDLNQGRKPPVNLDPTPPPVSLMSWRHSVRFILRYLFLGSRWSQSYCWCL